MKLYLEGVGLWSSRHEGFAALRSDLSQAPHGARPPAAMLSANERRRAPESVLLAIEVAGQAVAMSGMDARELPCIFSSAYGDQTISDYMCSTLARIPAELSPTRFHNSVHNAPAGYWTIATGCHASSSAITAGQHSVGAGLLEAAAFALAEQRPVLLVCSDVRGAGPLATMSGLHGSFGFALVLGVQPTSRSIAQLQLALEPGVAATPLPPDDAWCRDNPIATHAWPLLQRLARGDGEVTLSAADALALHVTLEPCQ